MTLLCALELIFMCGLYMRSHHLVIFLSRIVREHTARPLASYASENYFQIYAQALARVTLIKSLGFSDSPDRSPRHLPW